MKKITTLLLGLVLLLPALALAEEVPTFDFTAEEWLERYATLVPEDDPYYFTEFNNPELVGQTSRFFFRRQEFSTPADYIEVDSMKKEENVCLITVMTPYPYSGIELDPLLQSYESLRNMAERCILARSITSISDMELSKKVHSFDGIARSRRTVTKTYEYNLFVREYVNRRANGYCELCGNPAPFSIGSKPFLKTYHLTPLTQAGTDTPSNIAALCPNCYEKLKMLRPQKDLEFLKQNCSK